MKFLITDDDFKSIKMFNRTHINRNKYILHKKMRLSIALLFLLSFYNNILFF